MSEPLRSDLTTHWVDERIDYDGAALRAHWALRRFGIVGDALVAFRGACAVTAEEMADLEDLDGPGIAGDDMLHFVWERFDDGSLTAGVLRQRLLTCIASDAIAELAPAPVALTRDGDDLWIDGDRKLSISIATKSMVSSLIHFAVNVDNAGTPVETASLGDLGIDPEQFARTVLARVEAEEVSIRTARAKVRAKGETQA